MSQIWLLRVSIDGKFATKTAWHEMCVQSLIFGQGSFAGPLASTTPAFLTGKCTAAQSTAMDAYMPNVTFPTTVPATTSDPLNAYAISGKGSGSYKYDSASQVFSNGPARFSYNIDLVFKNIKSGNSYS